MKRYYTFLLIGILNVFVACSSDDDNVTPSMKDEDRLETLLDKTNEDIVAFKEKFGTYILYQFDQMKDFAYQFEEAANWRKAKITYLEKEDVAGAMIFLDENFLNCYQDSLKLKYFPRKLLICSRIVGASLGISMGKNSNHDAVVNTNSMSFAGLDRATLNMLTAESCEAYLQQLHYIYLAGHVIDVRKNLFVDDIFFDPSSKLYATKIDKTAGAPNENYYLSRGFFPITDPEELFYPQATEDLMLFVEKLVKMDQEIYDQVWPVSVMRIKMQYVAKGLKDFGVDIVKINPIAAKFL